MPKKQKIITGISDFNDFSSYLQVEGIFIRVFKIVVEFSRRGRANKRLMALMSHREGIASSRLLDRMLTTPFESGSPQ